jgi:hypothetical protein
MFEAYMDTYNPQKAKEFWPSYKNVEDKTDDLILIRKITALLEFNMNSQAQTFAARLDKHKWKIPPDELVLSYVDRVRNLNARAKQNSRWLFNLAYSWSDADNSYMCDMVLPLIPELEHKESVRQIKAFIDRYLPNLFKTKPSCADSALDIELLILKKNPSSLAERYLARQNWNFNKNFTSQYWTAAQQVMNSSQKKLGMKMLRVLAEKAPKDAPELFFVNSILDDSKSDFDSFWE